MNRYQVVGLYKNKQKKARWGKKKYTDNRNWPEYNEQLVVRGEFYLDLDFVDSWREELKEMNKGKVGSPFLFPESFLKWETVWHQFVDYRGLEGIARKLARFGLIPEYNDYTTIWYRVHKMKPEITLPEYDELDIGSDEYGLKTNNAGEYRVYKYGKKNTKTKYVVVIITADVKHKKLLGVDAHIEGEGQDEPKVALKHIKKLRKEGKTIKKFYGDGKFDTNEMFIELENQDSAALIPVAINASKNCSKSRRKAVIEQLGIIGDRGTRDILHNYTKEYRRKNLEKWRKRVKHGLRWPGTEGIFSAVKRKFGENVVSRKKSNMIAEAIQRFWAYDTICNYAIQKM